MSNQNILFRKVSLERLSSPEQLDQKLTVVAPVGWVAVISLALLITAAVSWGFLGTITDNVTGKGMLMYGGGIAAITAHTNGQVTDVYVQPGEIVEEGQVIAQIAQDDLLHQIESIETNLAALDAINIETLDLDIEQLSSELYTAFAPMASQIRLARTQQGGERAEAIHNTQSLENLRVMQEQRVSMLQSQIAALEKQISEYQNVLDHKNSAELEDALLYEEQMTAQRERLAATISKLEDDLAQANAKLQNVQSLFDAGAIAKIELDSINSEIARLELEIELRRMEQNAPTANMVDQILNRPNFDSSIASLQSQLTSLQAQLVQAQTEVAQLNETSSDYIWGAYNHTNVQIESVTQQYENQKQLMRQEYMKNLKELRELYDDKTVVKAPYSGIMSVLAIQRFDFIGSGQNLGSIVRGGLDSGGTNVILYVPLGRGKLVKPGMKVNISPTTVNREEYGVIIGEVKTVSVSPVTQQHMLTNLQNSVLVQTFSSGGAVLEVEVELLTDNDTVSGYKWSTPNGSPFAISPGTVTNAEIIVEGRRPIDMVVPFMKKLFIQYPESDI